MEKHVDVTDLLPQSVIKKKGKNLQFRNLMKKIKLIKRPKCVLSG